MARGGAASEKFQGSAYAVVCPFARAELAGDAEGGSTQARSADGILPFDEQEDAGTTSAFRAYIRSYSSHSLLPSISDDAQCRKSMARIKYVLNERRLAYEGALEIFKAQQKAHVPDESVALAKAQKEAEDLKKEQREKEKKERRAKAVPGGIKLAQQGLFENVQQEESVRS